MQSNIPLSVPNLNGNELQYVTHAIQTEWVSTGGPYVNSFEIKLAEYVNAKGAVSCQNGTSGLHTALLVCGVTGDDAVVVPTLTFIAAVNPVKYIGAEPIFMDCDESLTIDTGKMTEYFERECRFEKGKLVCSASGKHIRAMIIVHIFGNMADMEKIMSIADRYNIMVIEDATEALGTKYIDGKYKGKFAGTIGMLGVYSFNGNKIITTGGGGMLVSDSLDLLDRAKHLTTQAKCDDIRYIHDEIGYNYRMTNLQAALGLAQLEQLESFIEVKIENYNLYQSEIEKIQGLSFLRFRENTRSNHWFYALLCSNEYPLSRDELIAYLSGKGIQSRPIWDLISEQKPYVSDKAYKIKVAKHFWEHVVNLPCSTKLTKEEVLTVVECISSAINEC